MSAWFLFINLHYLSIREKLTFYFFIHLFIKGEFNSFWFAEELSNLRDRNYSMIRFRAHAPIGMIPIIKFEKITSTDSY